MNSLTVTTKLILLSPMTIFPIFTVFRCFMEEAPAFWFSVYAWQVIVLALCYEPETTLDKGDL